VSPDAFLDGPARRRTVRRRIVKMTNNTTSQRAPTNNPSADLHLPWTGFAARVAFSLTDSKLQS
jgi:hypothetical protein